jgi:sugar/nucleoside kinase (ribokinase family)
MRNEPTAAPRIYLVGGSRTTITVRPEGQMIWGAENPGTLSMTHGGLLYDLALRLAHAGADVSFFGVAGDDFAGQAALAQLENAGVATEGFTLEPGADTAAWQEILNLLDQPEMSFINEDVFGSLTPGRLARDLTEAGPADLIVAEACFPRETLEAIPEACPGIPLLLCPETPEQAGKAAGLLGAAAGLMLPRRSAEALYGQDVLSEESLRAAAEHLFGQGPSRVFITLGTGGLYYKDWEDSGLEGPGLADPARIILAMTRGASAREAADAAMNGGKTR